MYHSDRVDQYSGSRNSLKIWRANDPAGSLYFLGGQDRAART